jgi:hypothetical protein
VPTTSPAVTPTQCQPVSVWVCGHWGTFCWDNVCYPNPHHCMWVKKCVA